MARCLRQTTCLYVPFKTMLTARFLFLVTCISFPISLIWIQLVTSPNLLAVNESLVQEAIGNIERDSRYSEVYRKTNRLPKELKYILLWTNRDYAPLNYFGEGQRAFLKNNCSVINCYVTSDRKFFNDMTKFDAIAFNGRNLRHTDLPNRRSVHQKYIFFNMESADNYPVCRKTYDGFFNWTATYRLDSDIPFPYIMIRNKNGEAIGPKKDITWPKFPEISESFAEKLVNKSKAAAWFVSSCKSRSGRQDLVKRLQKALGLYKQTVDVYGTCGPLDCPRDKKNACNTMLQRDYFFYLALENSFDEDYVTEKLLTALQYDVVPIIYGGADYSRFLPPGSYLDARKHTASDLAAIMNRIIHYPKLYQKFFRWKHHLIYREPTSVENVCNVCAALNDQERLERTTVRDDFRKWWNPNYHERCRL